MKFTTALIDELKAIAGKSGLVRVTPDSRIVEIAPTTEDGVAQTLKLASRERIVVRTRIFPFGAEESPPNAYRTIQLGVSKIEGIVNHSVSDFVVTVRTGTKLKALQEALAPSGQWLPVDPPAESSMTIGEVIAKNEFGPRRTGYGSIRDYLLGARIVTPAGTIIKTGGAVVKAATGYDFHKLQIGALETLGVGLEFTLRLRARPAANVTVISQCASRGDAVEKALRVRDLIDSPAALFVISNLITKNDAAATLAVRYEGAEGAVDLAATRLAPVMGSARPDALEAEKLLMEAREAGLDPGFRTGGRAPISLRLSCRPSKMLVTIHTMAVALERYNFPVSLCAHPALGIADLWIPFKDGVDPRAVLLDARDTAARAGSGIVKLRRPFEIFGGEPAENATKTPALIVMERLKNEFDPHHLLNPGLLPFPSRAGEFEPDVPVAEPAAPPAAPAKH
ncbi:MAG: FAD-binding oxidoreductase [Planctomycetota bacterium]